ncbi:MAG: YbaB/EbfC family nucleoid-associated protein [Spirochaetes bacterium]|nr:YbaB/EbfC family nucleoid-associated protein [Spirochaetota bacterium]
MNFKDIGQLMKAQSELKKIQKRLKKTEVMATSRDEMVKATANGDNELVSIVIDEEKFKNSNVKTLERNILEAVNKALGDAKDLASKEMMKLTGEMDIFGMANELKKFMK